MFIIKDIPKTNKRWVSIKTDGEEYIITSNSERTKYILYKVVEDGYENIASGNNPLDLEEKYIWKDKYSKDWKNENSKKKK